MQVCHQWCSIKFNVGLAFYLIHRGAYRDGSAGVFRGHGHRPCAFCTGDGTGLPLTHQLRFVDVPANSLAHHRTAETVPGRGGVGDGVQPVRVHAVRAGAHRHGRRLPGDRFRFRRLLVTLIFSRVGGGYCHKERCPRVLLCQAITVRRGGINRATVTVPQVAQRCLTAAILLHVHVFHAYRVAHLQSGGFIQRDAANNRVTV